MQEGHGKISEYTFIFKVRSRQQNSASTSQVAVLPMMSSSDELYPNKHTEAGLEKAARSLALMLDFPTLIHETNHLVANTAELPYHSPSILGATGFSEEATCSVSHLQPDQPESQPSFETMGGIIGCARTGYNGENWTAKGDGHGWWWTKRGSPMGSLLYDGTELHLVELHGDLPESKANHNTHRSRM